MAIKLAFVMLFAVIIVALAMGLSFWYFNQRDAREHEKELRQMQQTDKLVEVAEEESSFEAEIEEE